MRIIVCIKQVLDLPLVKMQEKTRQPITRDVPYVIGDLDKNALEAAVQIKEQQEAEIIVLSLGWPAPDETILECLARGGERAVIIADSSFEQTSCQAVASVLAAAIKKIGDADLIILGEGSTDSNTGQMGPMLAQAMDMPLISYIKDIEISDGKIKATRSLEDCFEVVEAVLPAVVTATAEINDPRIPSIIEVIDASSKTQDHWDLNELQLSAEDLIKLNPIKVISNEYPQQVRKNIILDQDIDESVSSLVQKLAQEGALEL
jgi:electron transfer flavoprotein beta subunit